MRGASKDVRQFLKKAKRRGWAAEMTKNNHIRLCRRGATVFCPLTPSDWRSLKDVQAKMRRAEEGR